MARGGSRPNAGRKKGSATKKTRAVADRAAEQGITPLEVLLEAMRYHHGKGQLDEAAAIAKDAAPYIHPRLTAVKVGGDENNPVPITFIKVAPHAAVDRGSDGER